MFKEFIRENVLTPSLACFRPAVYKRKQELAEAQVVNSNMYLLLVCAPYVMWRYEHWKAMKNGGVAGNDYSTYELERPIQNYVFALPMIHDFVSGQPMMFEAKLFFAEYELVSN